MLPRTDPELKSLIPPLSAEEKAQLEHNIVSSNKCHDPIILWEGVIIDGHNRYEICIKHGIEFKIEELPLPSREAAKVWILDNQLGRRNINDAVKIELALLKAEILRKKAQENQSRAGGDKKSEESLLSKSSKAEMETIHVRKSTAGDAGISEGTLHNYLQIKEHGSPELLAQVQAGNIKIGTAHRMLTKEILKQLSQADKMYKFIAGAMPILADPASADTAPDTIPNITQEINTKLSQLSTQLNQLITTLEERR